MRRLLKVFAVLIGLLLSTARPAPAAYLFKHGSPSAVRPSGRIYLREYQYGVGPRYGYGWWGPDYVKVKNPKHGHSGHS